MFTSQQAGERVAQIIRKYLTEKRLKGETAKGNRWARMEIYKIVLQFFLGRNLTKAKSETFARIAAKTLFETIQNTQKAPRSWGDFSKILDSTKPQLEKQIQRLKPETPK